jgi:8-oxo-dGTP pyrophosphatase MutT (NUDIX family)
MQKTSEAEIQYGVVALDGIREKIGIANFLRALGISTTQNKIKFDDFPSGEAGEWVTVLKLGKLNIATAGVLLPDGNETALYTNVQMGVGNTGVPILYVDDKPYVVLTRQFRGAANMVFTELPAGGTNQGETATQAISREIAEETGSKVTKAVGFGATQYSGPGFTTDRQVPALAQVESIGKAQTGLDDSKEIIDVVAVPLEETAMLITLRGVMPYDDKMDTKSALNIMRAYTLYKCGMLRSALRGYPIENLAPRIEDRNLLRK